MGGVLQDVQKSYGQACPFPGYISDACVNRYVGNPYDTRLHNKSNQL